MEIKCIIIDDEQLAINVIKSYCDQTASIKVIGTFTNPINALSILSKEEVDIVFLDIEMPQISGIEFVNSLKQSPFIVFTTAYPQYALDGFEVNAVDYLVKPISFTRFLKAVNKVLDMNIIKNENTIVQGGEKPSGYIFIKSEYENIRLEVPNILYVQGLKDYLKIHVREKTPVLTLMSFKELFDKLPANQFLRVHKSYAVNINAISSIQRSKIIIGGKRIPIGDTYKDIVYNRLNI